MAPPSQSRPGRSLLVITLITLVAYGYIFWPFADHAHTPKLGLDLRGGTSVTLVPKTAPGQPAVTSGQIDQAVDIIRNRVNGFGVSEADVTTQGSGAGRTIVVSVPGQNQQRIVNLVGETAQLNFRKVLAESSGVPAAAATSTATPTSTSTGKATSKATPSATASSTNKNAPLSSAITGTEPKAAATSTPKASATPKATSSAAAKAAANAQTAPIQTGDLQTAFNNLDCSNPANTQGGSVDLPNKQMVTCSKDGQTKYALDVVTVSGKDVKSASATIQSGGVGQWVVNLDFNGKGTKDFAKVTGELTKAQSPNNQFAIVLDGLVVSSPQVTDGAITGGQAVISGSFTQNSANDLANVLKYGALPLSFDKAQVDTVSPTLGNDQLHAGLLAGAIGLLLVVLYLLMYYRALGFVAIASLVYAGLLTYALVVILGQTIGFTLTLAGVTGLIVSIGITADSFIVFFERLRDEVRDGRSLRVGVETGWVRARRTIVAADFVSILAAAILYFISVGSVRGFAFTLGLTTFVDLFIVFLFTKPLMTLLSRTKFFGNGSPMSGLDPHRLGVDRPPATPTAGRRPAAVKEA